MAPEPRERPGDRLPVLGVAAYLLVPGERRRRAAGHFGRAALETARGMRALAVPSRSELERRERPPAERSGEPSPARGRQKIEID